MILKEIPQKFKVGDRVVLKTDKYTPTKSNPKQNTEFACGGIISVNNSGHLRVDWDNGTSNGYITGDLDFASGLTCNSVW